MSVTPDCAPAVTITAGSEHDINLYAEGTPRHVDPEVTKPVRVFPGTIARGVEVSARMGERVVGRTFIDGIPVLLLEPAGVEGLPAYAGDMDPADRRVWHIVSTPAALGALRDGRGDVLVRYGSVRKADGRGEGATALAMYVAPSGPVRLARLLAEIEAADQDYARRYGLVLQALMVARELGYPAGFGWDEDNEEAVRHRCRVVVYIDLPSAVPGDEPDQVSWHMPEYPGEWDRHDPPTKTARGQGYAARVAAGQHLADRAEAQ